MGKRHIQAVHLGLALVLVAGLGMAEPSGLAEAAVAPKDRVVVGYFTSWGIYDRGYYPKDIPARLYTHINYAFAAPTAAGGCESLDPWADWQVRYTANGSVDGAADLNDGSQALRGNFNQLRKLKQKHPRLKALISLGGWTESNYFSDIALTADSRRAFVRACINRFIRGNLPFDPDTGTGGPRTAAGVFDGIDIDWEYPARQGEGDNSVRPDDRRNVTLLFREFRRQLDALGAKTGRRYLLTAAVPAARTAGASYELRRVGSILDWLNVMTYDFHGTWETRTNFNSPFGHDPADPNGSHWLTVKGTIDYLLSRGVPPDRLVVGVPFYGTAFLRAPSVNHGLFQVYSNAGLGSAPGWLNHANPTYRELVDVGRVVTEPTDGSPPVGQRKFTRYWNARAGEPWLWRPRMKIGDSTVSVVVTYPDPASLAQRVRLVRRLGLRGMMCWELSEDSASGALGRALAEVRKR